MPSTDAKNTNNEAAIIQRFISYDQSTHKQVATNSAAMAILMLSKNYYGESPTPELLNQEYETCIQALRNIKIELKGIDIESFKPAIEYCIEQTKQPIDDRLDIVTLFLPTADKPNNEEIYTLPLKEVLPLVWKALNDNEKFSQNYSDPSGKPLTHEEKLNLAKADLPFRLLSLLNSLERIRTETICHHGNRNEMVFTLNKAYPGIDIIEDERLHVMLVLKDYINELFWPKYQSATTQESKKELTTVMFEWIYEYNATPVLKNIDPDDNFKNKLKELFIQHGSNPVKIELNKIIEEVLSQLTFSCDPKKYPVIAMINSIFWIADEDDQDNKNAAKTAMQNWIKTNFQLNDKNHQIKISNFYAIHEAYKNLIEYLPKFHMTSFIDEETQKTFNTLQETGEAYFTAVNTDINTLPKVSNETLKSIQLLKSVITKFKKDAMVAEIENFFARWFGSENFHPDNKSLKILYKMLLDNDFQSKIIMTDAELEKFMESTTLQEEKEHGYRNITPYQINRVFLQAIITNHNQWSNIFKKTFQDLLQFVENNFNQTNIGLRASLKNDSYKPELLMHLNYLDKLSKNEEAKRPVISILLPSQITNIKEWMHVTSLMSDQQIKHFYQLQKVKINRIMQQELLTGFYEAFTYLKKSLPAADILPFFMGMGLDDAKKIFYHITIFANIVRLMPAKDKILFVNFLTIPFIEEIIKKIDYLLPAKEDFYISNTIIYLDCFPEKDKISLLTKLEFIKTSVKKSSHLKRIIDYLDINDRASYILDNFNLEDFKKITPTIKGFTSILDSLAKQDQLSFITDFMTIEYVKDSIIGKNAEKLTLILNSLHEGNRYTFAIDEIGITYIKDSIKDGNDIAVILGALPNLSKREFIFKYLTVEYIKNRIKRTDELNAFLEAIPDENKFDFITKTLGMSYILKLFGESHKDIAVLLALLIDRLPENKRYLFITDMLGFNYLRSLIYTGSQLGTFLVPVPENNKPDFYKKFGIENIKKIIQDDKQSILVTKIMKISNPYSIIQVLGPAFIKKNIKTNEQLIAILGNLFLIQEKISFLNEQFGMTRFKKRINLDPQVFDKILKDIDTESKLIDFIVKLGNDVIPDADRLTQIYKALRPSASISFITNNLDVEHFKKINNTFEQLIKSLACFKVNYSSNYNDALEKFLSFITQKPEIKNHINSLITNGKQLGQFLMIFQNQPRRWKDLSEKLSINVETTIKDATEFSSLLTQTGITDIAPLEYIKSIINNGSDLGEVLNAPAGYAFIKRYEIDFQTILKDYKELDAALRKITDEKHLADLVLKGAVVDHIKTIITDINQLINLLMLLPKENRYAFILSVGDMFIKQITKKDKTKINSLYDCLTPEEQKIVNDLVVSKQQISIDDIQQILPPKSSKYPFFASDLSTQLYNLAINQENDSQRFSVLASMVNKEENKNDLFCKAILEKFGEDFFVDISQKATPSSPHHSSRQLKT